jgi:hypothetical protein
MTVASAVACMGVSPFRYAVPAEFENTFGYFIGDVGIAIVTPPWLPTQARPEIPTAAALNIEPLCNMYCLFLLSLRFWRVQHMAGMN